MDVQRPRSSGLGSFSFSLVGIVGLLAVIVAGAAVWLLLTDPVTVAESVDSGEVTPLGTLAGRLDLRRAGQVAEIPVRQRSRRQKAQVPFVPCALCLYKCLPRKFPR